MIVVNVIVTSTEADIQALRGALDAVETASRAEPGCLDYTFSVELNNAAVLRITEKWQSLDDLKAHFEMPHLAEFRKAIAEHPPKDMQASFYEAKEIQLG